MDEKKQDATQIAKQTGLVNLAQYLMAVDSYNIESEEAKKAFAMVQQVCCMILLDTLRDFEYQNQGEVKKI